MKYTIRYTGDRLEHFGQCELDDENILCNDIVLPGERHPRNMRLWVIGNEYGALCAVWASCDQDALDAACDAGQLDSFLVSEEDQKSASEAEREAWAHLGGAGEPADLTYAWMAEAALDIARDYKLLFALAEARGAGQTNLFS